MVDISKIFLNEGLPGVEAHYEKEKEELRQEQRDSNKGWFRRFVLVSIVFIGIYCTQYKDREQYQTEAKETIAEGLKGASRINDSLVQYYNDPLVSDTVSDKSIKKMRTDIIKKHKK